jgi:signal transduction histidine kinase
MVWWLYKAATIEWIDQVLGENPSSTQPLSKQDRAALEKHFPLATRGHQGEDPMPLSANLSRRDRMHLDHELRTPLNAIMGFAEIMQQGTFGQINNPQYQEYLRHIRECGLDLLTKFDHWIDVLGDEAPSERSAGVRHAKPAAKKRKLERSDA